MHLDKYSAMFLYTWEDVVSLVVWNIFPHVILVSLHDFFSIQNVLIPNMQKLREHRFYAIQLTLGGFCIGMWVLTKQDHLLGHVISADGIAVDPEQLKSLLGLARLGRRLCRFPPTMFGESEPRIVQNFSGIVCWLWVWVCRISPRSRNLWHNCCARVSGIRGHQLISQLLMSWRSWPKLQCSHC